MTLADGLGIADVECGRLLERIGRAAVQDLSLDLFSPQRDLAPHCILGVSHIFGDRVKSEHLLVGVGGGSCLLGGESPLGQSGNVILRLQDLRKHFIKDYKFNNNRE